MTWAVVMQPLILRMALLPLSDGQKMLFLTARGAVTLVMFPGTAFMRGKLSVDANPKDSRVV